MIKEKREEIEGMEGARRATGIPSIGRTETRGSIGPVPDPEVREKATRRRFTAQYKLRILRLADGCTEPGSLGALLRREGIYHSNLNTWRRQRDDGMLSGLSPKKRGRKRTERNPLQKEVERLKRENEH
jgi:transposase-like protein